MRPTLIVLLLLIQIIPSLAQVKHTIPGFAQGTTYSITYYHERELLSKSSADSIFASIDSSLSIYKPYSLISRFNTATDSIVMDPHLFAVVQSSLQIHKASNGIFDITIKPLMDLWGFGQSKRDSLPSSEEIKNIMNCIGSHHLTTKDSVLRKNNSYVQIDVNGIAQGYTVDVLSNFLTEIGIRNFIIELGGEIRANGRKNSGKTPFKVGIEVPSDDLLSPHMVRYIVLDSGAITTSGSYRKYYEVEGRRISHLIDPRSGFPSDNKILSVSVVAPTAMIADAWDNVFMLVPLSESIELLQKLNDIEAFIVYRNSDGTLKTYKSKGFPDWAKGSRDN